MLSENRLFSFCVYNTQGKLLNPRRCRLTGENGAFVGKGRCEDGQGKRDCHVFI